jgi:hypothetical protein
MNFLKLIKEKMMELEPIMKEKRAEQFDSMVSSSQRPTLRGGEEMLWWKIMRLK